MSGKPIKLVTAAISGAAHLHRRRHRLHPAHHRERQRRRLAPDLQHRESPQRVLHRDLAISPGPGPGVPGLRGRPAVPSGETVSSASTTAMPTRTCCTGAPDRRGQAPSWLEPRSTCARLCTHPRLPPGNREYELNRMQTPNRLLKRAHLRRWLAWALVAAYQEYASLGPSRVALHLGPFEQAGGAAFQQAVVLAARATESLASGVRGDPGARRARPSAGPARPARRRWPAGGRARSPLDEDGEVPADPSACRRDSPSACRG